LHGVALDGTEDQIFDDEADHDYCQQPGNTAGISNQVAFSKMNQPSPPCPDDTPNTSSAAIRVRHAKRPADLQSGQDRPERRRYQDSRARKAIRAGVGLRERPAALTPSGRATQLRRAGLRIFRFIKHLHPATICDGPAQWH